MFKRKIRLFWINRAAFQAAVPGAFGSLLFALCYMLLCCSRLVAGQAKNLRTGIRYSLSWQQPVRRHRVAIERGNGQEILVGQVAEIRGVLMYLPGV